MIIMLLRITRYGNPPACQPFSFISSEMTNLMVIFIFVTTLAMTSFLGLSLYRRWDASQSLLVRELLAGRVVVPLSEIPSDRASISVLTVRADGQPGSQPRAVLSNDYKAHDDHVSSYPVYDADWASESDLRGDLPDDPDSNSNYYDSSNIDPNLSSRELSTATSTASSANNYNFSNLSTIVRRTPTFTGEI